MEMTVEEIQAHIPGTLTPEMVKFARENMPSYIFTKRTGKKQHAYCTRCGNEWVTPETYSHGEMRKCPSCKAAGTVKASGRPRGKLVDELLFFWFLPSLIGKNCITAVGMYASRDYRQEYRNIETQFLPRSLYVFDYGVGAAMVKRQVWHPRYYGEYVGLLRGTQYQTQKSISMGVSRYVQTWSYWLPWAVAEESIKPAVKGTPFARCGWEQMDMGRIIEFFALAAKYPSVEYLNKLGCGRIVQARVDNEPTYGVRFQGKNIKSVLGVSKADVREIRKPDVDLTPYELKFLKQLRKTEPTITFGTAMKALKSVNHDGDSFLKMLAYGSLDRCEAYIDAQLKMGYEKYTNARSYTIRDYLDYMRECNQLGLDLSDTAIKWPHDLRRAHTNTSAQVEYAKNKVLDEQCGLRGEKLANAYTFTHGDLVMRPAMSATELIAEGKALSHCVGGYANRYAAGQTIICFVRRVSEPDEPYHTLEFSKDGRLIQCRGRNNKTDADDRPSISAFLAAFEARQHDQAAQQKAGNKKKRGKVA